MIKHVRILISVMAILPITGFAVEKSITAEDGFALSTAYFEPEESSGRAMLMLHQCNYNRSMYDQLGKSLAKQGIHAISLDFRGFGKSIAEGVNVNELDGLPQEQQREAWEKMSSHWSSDVNKVLSYLKQQAGADSKIGVIGASCGGSLAVRLSESHQFDALALFSSAQGEKNIERYGVHLKDTPTLIIAAEEDGNTYKSAKSIFAQATNPASKFISYKGGAHGYPLYEQDKTLATSIVTWFNANL